MPHAPNHSAPDHTPNARDRLETMSRAQLLELLIAIGTNVITAEDADDAVLGICERLKVRANGDIGQLHSPNLLPRPDIEAAFAMVANGNSVQIINPPHREIDRAIDDPIYIVAARDLQNVSAAAQRPVTIGDPADEVAARRARIAAKLGQLADKIAALRANESILCVLDTMVAAADPGPHDLRPVPSPPCPVDRYQCVHAVEAARWNNTAEDRERFSAWFEQHLVMFVTNGARIVLPEEGHYADVGEWVMWSDGEFIVMEDQMFQAEYRQVTP